MCGIYGFIGRPDKITPQIIEKLGKLNVQRGADSTGVAWICSDASCVIKQAISSPVFFNNLKQGKRNSFLNNYYKRDTLAILGHTRFATRGAVNNDNAHPFENDNLISTHNGVIYNFDALQTKFSTDYQVDSQIIGHLLAQKDVKMALKQLEGYFCVPYMDRKQPTILNVAVYNADFSYSIWHDQLYYSSDSAHLETALKLYGDRAKLFETVNGASDIIYKFEATDHGIIKTTDKIGMPTIYQTYSDPYYRTYSGWARHDLWD